MSELSTSDRLRTLLNTLEREMMRTQILEDSASSDLTTAFYQGVQCGLAFAAGSCKTHSQSSKSDRAS